MSIKTKARLIRGLAVLAGVAVYGLIRAATTNGWEMGADATCRMFHKHLGDDMYNEIMECVQIGRR